MQRGNVAPLSSLLPFEIQLRVNTARLAHTTYIILFNLF